MLPTDYSLSNQFGDYIERGVYVIVPVEEAEPNDAQYYLVNSNGGTKEKLTKMAVDSDTINR